MINYSTEQLQFILKEYIESKNFKEIRNVFAENNIVDLAEIFESMNIEEKLLIFRILPKDISAEIFSYIDSEAQEELIYVLTSKELSSILDNMFSDDIVEFLEEMPANVIKKILTSIPNNQRDEINKLLSYKEFSAGAIMSTDFIELNQDLIIIDVIKKIKKEANLTETIDTCFVVNDKRNYLGAVSLKDIILADEDDKVSSLITDRRLFVYTNNDQEEVAKIIKENDLDSIAVLNSENCLIGIITADDIVDVLVEEATEDIHKMAGINNLDDSYIKTPIKDMVKSRVNWLLFLMISGSFIGYILHYYEAKIGTMIILSVNIPIIMSTSGNAGSQSSATIIRAISTEKLTIKKHLFKVIKKEFLISILSGIIIFIANYFRIVLLGGDSVNYTVAFVVSLSLFISLIISNVIGGILPLIAKQLNIDPASMAAPIITTIVDATSLSIYFYLAMYFLNI